MRIWVFVGVMCLMVCWMVFKFFDFLIIFGVFLLCIFFCNVFFLLISVDLFRVLCSVMSRWFRFSGLLIKLNVFFLIVFIVVLILVCLEIMIMGVFGVSKLICFRVLRLFICGILMLRMIILNLFCLSFIRYLVLFVVLIILYFLNLRILWSVLWIVILLFIISMCGIIFLFG